MRTDSEITEMSQELAALRKEIQTIVNTKQKELESVLTVPQLVAFGNWVINMAGTLQTFAVVLAWIEGTNETDDAPSDNMVDFPTFLKKVHEQLNEVVNQLPVVNGSPVLRPDSKLILP